MIISLDKRYIFVANLKTASTSIEQVLEIDSGIALRESRFAKHLSYQLIEEHFAWVFKIVPRDRFFIFGVIRDPVGYLLSLYNSHRDMRFQLSADLSTHDMPFDEFVTSWKRRNEEQMVPQQTRFLDRHGRLAPNYIISYNNLFQGLTEVGERIGVPRLSQINRENCSETSLTPDMLDEKQLKWICETYSKDYECLENQCDRILR